MQLKTRLHTLKNKLRRAFTITELVIVIAVIAILAAVLIPTFSNVINNSKKSADDAMLKQLNEASYHYAVSNPGKLEIEDGFTNCLVVYTNLMTGLKNAGYTDESNPYLLACDIQQDNKYLIWYYQSNTFGLIDDIEMSLFNSNYAPNFYMVKTNDSSTWGFVLSNYNSGDKGAYAELYYAMASEENVDAALADFIKKNQVWGAAVEKYIANDKAGLTTAGANVSWAANVGSNSPSTTVQTVTLSATTSQAAAKNLAGILSVVTSGNTLKNTKIVFESRAADGTPIPVDLTGTTWTPMSNAHRDSMAETTTFEGSLDFSNTLIEGLTITNNYVSASAAWQDQADNGYPGGGYNVTYGLFGCLNGLNVSANNPVTVSNLTMVDCNVVLNGSTTSINGTSTQTLTDCAGLVCGFAVGNVKFENINIGTASAPCSIQGYDAVGGLVGRYYAFDNKTATTTSGWTRDITYLTVENCNIYANVFGSRRSGGIVGYTGALNDTDVSINKVVVGHSGGSGVKVTDTLYQGLVYCDGLSLTCAQFGAIIGGGASSVMAGGFTVNGLTVNAKVFVKNDSKDSGGNYNNVALAMADTDMVLYSGITDQALIVGAKGLVINSSVAVTYNERSMTDASLLTLTDYATVLPYMLVTPTGEGTTVAAGSYKCASATKGLSANYLSAQA